MACDYLFLQDRTPEATLIAIPEVASVISEADTLVLLAMPDPYSNLLQHDEFMLLADVTQELQGGGGGLAQASFNVTIENNGAVLAAGNVASFRLYQAATIVAATLTAEQVGNLVVDIKYCSFASYPSGLASIVASAPPTLTGAQKVEDTTLTGWTTAIGPGVIEVVVNSATTITKATLALHLAL